MFRIISLHGFAFLLQKNKNCLIVNQIFGFGYNIDFCITPSQLHTKNDFCFKRKKCLIFLCISSYRIQIGFFRIILLHIFCFALFCFDSHSFCFRVFQFRFDAKQAKNPLFFTSKLHNFVSISLVTLLNQKLVAQPSGKYPLLSGRSV